MDRKLTNISLATLVLLVIFMTAHGELLLTAERNTGSLPGLNRPIRGGEDFYKFMTEEDLLSKKGAPFWPGMESGPVYKSPIQVFLSPDEKLAYVLCRTSSSIIKINTNRRAILKEFSVDSYPAYALMGKQGHNIYVSNDYTNKVSVFNLKSGIIKYRWRVGMGPYGMALSPDGRTLYVANSLSSSISALNTQSGRLLYQVSVGDEPLFVDISPDARHLLVGCSKSRDFWLIDRETHRVLSHFSSQQPAMIRQISFLRDNRWAVAVHTIARDKQLTTQSNRGWIFSHGFSLFDRQNNYRATTLLLDTQSSGAANPWGIATSKNGKMLYISLSGVHELAIVNLEKAISLSKQTPDEKKVELAENVEILAKKSIINRVPTGGSGPKGVALLNRKNEIWVTNYFSDNVTILNSETGKLIHTISLGGPKHKTLLRKGEELFCDAMLCYENWYSCSSCHKGDGTTDGLNWDLLNDGSTNPKNVKSMHDAHDTPPAMWTGVRSGMFQAIAGGFRFLGRHPEEKDELAIRAFIGSLRHLPNPYRGKFLPAVRRGKRLFYRARCDYCHPPPRFTDLKKHDLMFQGENDRRSRFDTPSLRDCFRTAPYLHDGRAKNLKELFLKHNKYNWHGQLQGFTDTDLEDLIAYLRTL